MSANEIPRSSRTAGVVSILVVSGATAAVLLTDSLPFEFTAPPFIFGHYLVSIWFAVVGFKARVKWMPIWLAVFFVFLPPATIVFWYVNRRLEFRVWR